MNITTSDQNEISKLEKQIEDINIIETKYQRDDIRTFFPWKLHFAEVFNENGGFDIVIGNPPYVNIANIEDKSLRKNLQDNYVTVKNKSDLYSVFTEKGFLLLKQK